jgi:hypothetical protein
MKMRNEQHVVRNGKKCTSIGGSVRTKPKNKAKRKSFKKSKGQGSGRR